MKKIFAIILIVVLAIVGFRVYAHFTNKDGQSRVTNTKAEKDEENRYLTIINETKQVINEVYVSVGEGTNIEECYQKNPDETSFSVKIPKAYKEEDTFVVTLLDRYGLKYQKQVSNVEKGGRTEVKVTKSDYVKQKGDWKRKIDRLFNGD